MASVTPRASGLWAQSSRSSYFEDDENEMDVEEQQLVPEYDVLDARTPLDKTIDRIGMGNYQWTLLSLCGFGWMADNMWIQAVAIILPRVQQHYSVPDNYIGTVSSSMFAGMMFGAVGWGTCSDLLGRSTAFNATLFFTSLFGLLASFANSFPSLCVLLFFLGSAVGGSMPTDGTLLLEHMPEGKQYLVTALSVFFSFGAVLSAVVALLVIPHHSCSLTSNPCDVNSENQGWKYMLITLGLITLSMFLARIVFFRLHESPRFLVHAGRPQEAVISLRLISQFNGSELDIDLEDVEDRRPPPILPSDEADSSAHTPFLSTSSGNASPDKDYHATGESPTPLDAHTFTAPQIDSSIDVDAAFIPVYVNTTPAEPLLEHGQARELSRSPTALSRSQTTPPRRSSVSPHSSRVSNHRLSSAYETKMKGVLPRWLTKPFLAWLDRVAMVLGPEWLQTTLLVWAVWCALSLGFTMFNVFLPKLLETGSNVNAAMLAPKTIEDSLWDVVIFTIGGCPGAILGAYIIDSPLGRRWSLAGSTFITAIFCVVFVQAKSAWAVRVSTTCISLSATTMWAVLYGWTPEIFGTKVRGTACGIASALSRVGGMIAPILGGILLMMDRSVPVYTSVVIFAIAGLCILLLKDDSGDRNRRKGVL